MPDPSRFRGTARVLLALPTLIVPAAAALVGAAPSTATTPPLYARAATQSCLTALPHAVAGLPPATPPAPATLFVYALAQRRPHRLGVWYGDTSYEGIVLTFFKSTAAARNSFTSLAGSYGGKLIRNVVATWVEKPAPRKIVRHIVLGCLRPGVARTHPTNAPPLATVATFAGGWGGHTRRLSITTTGRGREDTDDGCCRRVYRLTLQILSVSGTLTRATARYRVISFRRDEAGVRLLHPGESGRLVLKNGIVTNSLTGVFFCSDPAWGATGACGA